jgi:hypothetical protein
VSRGRLDGKAYIRALLRLAPSDIHTVLSSVSKTRQCIVSPSFPSSRRLYSAVISESVSELRGSRGAFNGFELRSAKLSTCSVSNFVSQGMFEVVHYHCPDNKLSRRSQRDRDISEGFLPNENPIDDSIKIDSSILPPQK